MKIIVLVVLVISGCHFKKEKGINLLDLPISIERVSDNNGVFNLTVVSDTIQHNFKEYYLVDADSVEIDFLGDKINVSDFSSSMYEDKIISFMNFKFDHKIFDRLIGKHSKELHLHSYSTSDRIIYISLNKQIIMEVYNSSEFIRIIKE